jgi:co-chaperonin GroES (HSP10)
MPAAEIYNLADAADPLKEMLKKVGDLSKIDVAGARVLVWMRIAPRMIGSIHMPDSVVKEDVWQSSVGYVLKTGPLAFQEDTSNHFGGFAAKAGDWVLYTPGEGKRVQINGVDCRLIEDALIQMKIADPAIITHRQ